MREMSTKPDRRCCRGPVRLGRGPELTPKRPAIISPDLAGNPDQSGAGYLEHSQEPSSGLTRLERILHPLQPGSHIKLTLTRSEHWYQRNVFTF